ncbi:MAG: integrin alpha [Planctomycetota bacterium]|nr:integrin alpha [Planctomycetota bacterium]
MIGAPFAGANGEGQVYVVFGSTSVTSSNLTPADLNGTNGLLINAANAGDNLGYVDVVGDMNGDGIPELLLGAGKATTTVPRGGSTYLVWGGANLTNLDAADGTTDGVLSLANFNATFGYRIDGVASGFEFSTEPALSVRGLGDINGDTIADIAIGSPNHDRIGLNDVGQVNLIFGGAVNLGLIDAADGAEDGVISVDSIDETTGLRLEGIAAGDSTGVSVANGGDINGDGSADIVISAPFASPGGINAAGEVFIVFGGAANLNALNDADGTRDALAPLTALNGTTGYRIQGDGANGLLGFNLSGTADIDEDGNTDVAVYSAAGNGKGAVYLGGGLAGQDEANGSIDGVISLAAIPQPSPRVHSPSGHNPNEVFVLDGESDNKVPDPTVFYVLRNPGRPLGQNCSSFRFRTKENGGRAWKLSGKPGRVIVIDQNPMKKTPHPRAHARSSSP